MVKFMDIKNHDNVSSDLSLGTMVCIS